MAEPDLTSDQRHRLRFSLAKHLKEHDPSAAGRAEALGLFEQLARDRVALGYLEGHPGPSIADLAGPAAYELKHLQVGCPVPDLAGPDLAGRPLKLSDYRGKVVVPAFGTSDCSACVTLVPHERRAAERFRGRPFAVVGVNCDADLAHARAKAAGRRVPWRTVWAGAGRPPGGVERGGVSDRLRDRPRRRDPGQGAHPDGVRPTFGRTGDRGRDGGPVTGYPSAAAGGIVLASGAIWYRPGNVGGHGRAPWLIGWPRKKPFKI